MRCSVGVGSGGADGVVEVRVVRRGGLRTSSPRRSLSRSDVGSSRTNLVARSATLRLVARSRALQRRMAFGDVVRGQGALQRLRLLLLQTRLLR